MTPLKTLTVIFAIASIYPPTLAQANTNSTSTTGSAATTSASATPEAAYVKTGQLSITNEYYTVYVDAESGLYTISTAKKHRAGDKKNVLYGGGRAKPGTSFNTIRVFRDGGNTDFTQDNDAEGETNLKNASKGTMKVTDRLLRTRYEIRPSASSTEANPIQFNAYQEITLLGATEATSAVLVTTKIENLGKDSFENYESKASEKFGLRYLWDFQIGSDDGPAFSTSKTTSSSNKEEQFIKPSFQTFSIQDNDGENAPTFSVKGTVSFPAFQRRVHAPTKLLKTCWPKSSETHFDYAISPTRIITKNDESCVSSRGGDGAVLYYFGDTKDNAAKIHPNEIRTFSAAIFLEPKAVQAANRTDSDGDGLWDVWEKNGIDLDGDGTIDQTLPAGLDPKRKDIIVYYDWAPKNKPLKASIDRVVAAFSDAPVKDTDGKTRGIGIHFIEGKEVSVGEDGQIGVFANGAYSWKEFADIKARSFPAGYWPAAHYAIFADNYGSGSSGSSRIAYSVGKGSSDFIVTIGRFNKAGDEKVRLESGTIMHELGHNLGLGHGGRSNGVAIQTHRKPNYLSVMNYSFQFNGIPTKSGYKLDYSRFKTSDLPTLDESSMNEKSGMQIAGTAAGATKYQTRQYCADTDYATLTSTNSSGTSQTQATQTAGNSGTTTTGSTSTANATTTARDGKDVGTYKSFKITTVDLAATLDWNCNGSIDSKTTKYNVNADWGKQHKSYEDWNNLVYTGGAIGGLGAAHHLPMVTSTAHLLEPTLQDYEDMKSGIFVDRSQQHLLIPNGSFEYPMSLMPKDPDYPQDDVRIRHYDDTELQGWTVTGSATVYGGDSLEAAEGARVLAIAGEGLGRVEREFETTKNTYYRLRFATHRNAFDSAGQTLEAQVQGLGSPYSVSYPALAGEEGEEEEVLLDDQGVEIAWEYHGEETEWDYHIVDFKAVGPKTKITFKSAADSTGAVILDDVTVYPIEID